MQKNAEFYACFLLFYVIFLSCESKGENIYCLETPILVMKLLFYFRNIFKDFTINSK